MQATTQKRRVPVIFRVLAGLFITITSLIGVFFFLTVILAQAMRRREWRDRIRRFDKHTLNPKTLRLAGKRSGFYGAIHHVGRSSGNEHVTPIVVGPLDDGFVIPLPYGSDTDWCRNVMSAGTCTLDWKGHKYELEHPEIVPAAEALKAYPLLERIFFRYSGIPQYLRLHRYAEESEAVTIPG